MFGQGTEDGPDLVAQIEAAVEDQADVEQQRQFVAPVGRERVSRFGYGDGTFPECLEFRATNR